MKRISFLILTVIACIIFAGDAMAAGKKVAVYVEGDDLSETQKSIISSTVLDRLLTSHEYRAFERNASFINSLNEEQYYQLWECPTREIRAIGQRFGVDYVLVVKVDLIYDGCSYMYGRLNNLVTGEIVKSAQVRREYKNSDTLANMAQLLTYNLISNTK